MKILINESGQLLLERNGVMKLQRCPFKPDDACSDECPLFCLTTKPDEPNGRTLIELCKRHWLCYTNDFQDLRGEA